MFNIFKNENKVYILDKNIFPKIITMLQNPEIEFITSANLKEIEKEINHLAKEYNLFFNPPRSIEIADIAITAYEDFVEKIAMQILEEYDLDNIYIQKFDKKRLILEVIGKKEENDEFVYINIDTKKLNPDDSKLEKAEYYNKKWGKFLITYDNKKVLYQSDF